MDQYIVLNMSLIYEPTKISPHNAFKDCLRAMRLNCFLIRIYLLIFILNGFSFQCKNSKIMPFHILVLLFWKYDFLFLFLFFIWYFRNNLQNFTNFIFIFGIVTRLKMSTFRYYNLYREIIQLGFQYWSVFLNYLNWLMNVWQFLIF
jgi:hypothetical protein